MLKSIVEVRKLSQTTPLTYFRRTLNLYMLIFIGLS